MAEIEKPRTFKEILRAFILTLIMAGIAVVVEVIMPLMVPGTEFKLAWYDLVGPFVVFIANAFKQDDNPIRFWDSTLVGAVVGAVVQFLVVSFATRPPVFDWRVLFGALLPPLIVLATSFARGYGKGYRSPEGGT